METAAIMAEDSELEVKKKKKKKKRPHGTSIQPINSKKGEHRESLEMLANHNGHSQMFSNRTKEGSPELNLLVHVNASSSQVTATTAAGGDGRSKEEQSLHTSSPVWLLQQPNENVSVTMPIPGNEPVCRNEEDGSAAKLPLKTSETLSSTMSAKLDHDDSQVLNVQTLDGSLKAVLNSADSGRMICDIPNSNNGKITKPQKESQIGKSDVGGRATDNQQHVLQVGGQGFGKTGMEKENLIEKKEIEDGKASVVRSAARWKKLQNTLKATNEVQRPASRDFKRKSSGMNRQDSFLQRFSTRQREPDENEDEEEGESKKQKKKSKREWTFVVNPDGDTMFYWLAIQAVCALYNLWTLIAREAFPDIQSGSPLAWFILDGFMDFMYLTDIAFQFRTGYLEQGLIVYDSKQLALHYVKSRYFVIDIVALTPLDLLQFITGIHPMWRFPRFLKVYRVYQFYYMAESRTIYPNFWRVINLIHILLLGSHWFAAFYFLICKSEDFPANDWSYPPLQGEYASVTRMYLKSLYWSTLTLTTIGDLPPPKNNWEYVFTILSYLIGVFVFATIVGQVGNVIANRNASRLEFERLLDGAKAYMRNHNVPRDMQTRVQRWYDYAWSRGRISGGGDINSLGLLPDKLKTELALHVNLETLRKVTIFQECEPEFLHDLVLKMKAYIFTPGDLICRKGEVAREMFIIADGVLEVLSESGEVVTQMVSGDFFGEIGILNLDGGVNRRTADVRSVGYSELFVLSREDVLSALQDHPEAEAFMQEYGRKRLKEIEERRRKKLLQNQVHVATTLCQLTKPTWPVAKKVKKNVKFKDKLTSSDDENEEDSASSRRVLRASSRRRRYIKGKEYSPINNSDAEDQAKPLVPCDIQIKVEMCDSDGSSKEGSDGKDTSPDQQLSPPAIKSVSVDINPSPSSSSSSSSPTPVVCLTVDEGEENIENLPSVDSDDVFEPPNIKYVPTPVLLRKKKMAHRKLRKTLSEEIDAIASKCEKARDCSHYSDIGVPLIPASPSQKSSMASLRSHSCDCVLNYNDSSQKLGEVDLQNLKSFQKSNSNKSQPTGSETAGPSSSSVLVTSEIATDSSKIVQGGEASFQKPAPLLTGLRSVLLQNMDAVINQFEDKVKTLENDNKKKADEIKELESRVKSLQRALLWKTSKDTGVTVPSVDI